MNYLGDIAEDATIVFMWSTNGADGASITRATDGTVSVYKDDGDTQSVAGITDTEDFDSLTGIHMCKIDTSADAFYVTGSDYAVVLSAATIDGQTVNAVIGLFSIENRFAEVDVTKIGGDAQSATDLKDFADAGYDPGTNKVQGVVLTDTATAVTDGVTLANDAITAAKYDESTAFPLKSDDAGSTEVARTGADSDTLETLSDQIDGPVVANVTQLGGVAQSLTDLKDFADAGYDPGTNKVQGVVLTDTTTDVSNEVSADAVKISGDSTAADNLESMYDGNGYVADTGPSTQAQVGNLSTGSAAISTTATSTEATTPAPVGTPTNTYTATIQEDGVYHSWIPDTGELEFAYNFNIGANASPTDVIWTGYCQGINDEVAVYARNWVGAAWEQVGTIIGTALATTQEISFILTVAHVNTGANSGDVRLRFVSTGGSIITTFATDRILCSYTITNQSVGYANGSIWIDTTASNENTVDYVDGVADNPVSTLAAALTISASVGINRFEIAPQSSFAFAQTMTGYSFNGTNYAIDLSDEDSGSLYLFGATVTGLLTASGSVGMIRCRLSDGCTVPSGGYGECTLPGDITLSGTFYLFDDCISVVAGTDTPSIDLQSGSAQTVNFRHYSGGIEVKNMKAGDNMSLEGHGQLIINANCSGGTIAIRGAFNLTDNSGNVTIADDARLDLGQSTAAAQAVIVTNNLDHLCKTATGGADMTTEVVDNTILSRVLANGDTSGFTPSTDGLQPIRDRGDAAWVTGSGGDATEAKQDEILVDLVDVKGTGFVKDTNSLVNVTGGTTVNWTVEATVSS